MTNKISSASQTVRAFNVGTLGDCSAWDDNLDAATLAACALLDLMPWVFATVIRSSSKA